MDKDTATRLKAYAAHKAALYWKLINVFIQDWYECLELKSLGSSWLLEYPQPKMSRRHWLLSNVTAYHSGSQFPDDMDDTLANDPPDVKDTVNAANDSEMDFDNF